jgi:uncharacterized protein
MKMPSFEWDESKNQENIAKHGVSFQEAQQAFEDEKRVILVDVHHSNDEQRYFCLGKINNDIMTIRFTYRAGNIRIFGAAYWRKGKKRYEEANNIHG